MVVLLNDVTLSLATRHDLYLLSLIAAVLECNFVTFILQDWDLATNVLSQLNLSDFKKRFYDLGLKKFHYIIVHNLIAYNVYHSVQLLVCCHLRYNHGSKTRTCHVILKPWLYSFKL